MRESIKIYAWAPKPYHKFMEFKVIQRDPSSPASLPLWLILVFNVVTVLYCVLQSFNELPERPLLVDLTVEEGQRLKVIFGSQRGFHAIDLDTSQVFDIYLPQHVRTCKSSPLLGSLSNKERMFNVLLCVLFQTQGLVTPHTIVILPNNQGMQLLLCYDSMPLLSTAHAQTGCKLFKLLLLWRFRWGCLRRHLRKNL